MFETPYTILNYNPKPAYPTGHTYPAEIDNLNFFNRVLLLTLVCYVTPSSQRYPRKLLTPTDRVQVT